MAAHVFTIEDIRLAKSLGLLGDLRKQDAHCTWCGWPTHGVYHREHCGRARRAHKAPPAPTQPWDARKAA
jgi:hypothetical protein